MIRRTSIFRLLVGLILLAMPFRLDGAIAYDSVSSNTATNVATRSWNHTLVAGSGNNRVVVVGITSEDTTAADQALTNVTFNGVAMTAVTGGSAINANSRVNLYRILDASLPAAAGVYAIQVTFAGTVSDFSGGAIAVTGAAQANPEAVGASTADSSATIATSLTTLTNNAWTVAVVAAGTVRTFTTSNSTERWDVASASAASAGSTNAVATAGSTTVTWTPSSSTARLAQAVAAFAPATAATITLGGTVFEDVTYAGGAGRTKVASSGVSRAGARVEIYTAAGAFSAFTTTDASGNYSFSVAASASYTIRVVNSTVTSSLGGTGLLPVQTFRTTATSGSAVAVTDRVGGEDPTKADAANGSTTLAALTTTTLTPQSVTSVTAGTSNIAGLDFGFNFSTVVNPANAGQGSLRQFITNANAMTGTQAGAFMISDGGAHPGLRAGLTNQLTSGVAVITLTSALPQITGALTLDGTSQTTNVGNTNAGTLGTGGTVGVGAVTLATVNRPEVEIVGTSAIGFGLDVNAAGVTLRGFAIHGFGLGSSQADIQIGGVSGALINQCVIGATATSFSPPSTGVSNAIGIRITGTSGTITNSLVGFTVNDGVAMLVDTTTGWTISGNEFRGTATGNAANDALHVRSSGNLVSGNLFRDNHGPALDVFDNSSSATIINNTITGNGIGTAGTAQTSGIRLTGTGHTVDRNIISANYGAGILVRLASATGNRFTHNSIFDNGTILNAGGAGPTGQIGIDLLAAAGDGNTGTAPFVTLNDSGDGDAGANTLLNYPVLEAATIVGSNLEFTGLVAAGATVEFFVSDSGPASFGEGRTFIAAFVEGGGGDLDPTTGSYSSSVNCFPQGADSGVARFKFVMAKPASVGLGTIVTATATNGAGNTSEFGGGAAVDSNLPDFSVVKSAQTVSDPVNSTTNPKAIPGGVAQYAIVITNSNRAISDTDSFVFTDAIPANTALYVGNLAGAGSGPVAFVDGATSCALTYTFASLASTTDDLDFSADNGATWTYVPVPDASGFDAAVTTIRITPQGAFARALCGATPSATFRFRVRVQ